MMFVQYNICILRLLNIVPAEIAVNVLIGCLYIGMRDYIYSPGDYIYNPANVN